MGRIVGEHIWRELLRRSVSESCDGPRVGDHIAQVDEERIVPEACKQDVNVYRSDGQRAPKLKP